MPAMSSPQPSDPSSALRVRVPASTSNLGPGFDLLGLALSLFLEVELRPAPGTLTLERGPGCEDWPPRNDNRLVASFDRALTACGVRERGCVLHARSEIPVGRGFGSSGAAIVAGILLASEIAPRSLTLDEQLALAIELEGHPDNVTPALLGGCTLSAARIGAAPLVVQQSVHRSLAFALAWPAATLETTFARKLLPQEVPFADAAENPRRLAMLLEGLRTGQRDLIAFGEHDRLHVPYRLPHIRGGAEALTAARNAGAWLATVSGSGSGLIAIGERSRIVAIADAMRAAFEDAGQQAWARQVEPVFEPSEVTRA